MIILLLYGSESGKTKYEAEIIQSLLNSLSIKNELRNF